MAVNFYNGVNIMKISVIIPVYNCARYIRQTLDLIRMQNFDSREIETIIYLDGCTDTTADEVAIYAKQYPKFNLRAIRADVNMGPSNARNAALAIARGEYIHFMDADDVINTDFYKSLYDAATRTDSDVAVSSFFHERWPNDSVIFDQEIVLGMLQDKMDATHVDTAGYSWRYLIRRAFWERNHFAFPTDMKYCEDLLLMNRVVCYSNRLVLVPGAKYLYKFRPNSLLTTHSTRKLQNVYYNRARADVYVFLAQYDLSRGVVTRGRTYWRLFGFIPVVIARRDKNRTKTWYYLFGIIPFMCVRNKNITRLWKL